MFQTYQLVQNNSILPHIRTEIQNRYFNEFLIVFTCSNDDLPCLKKAKFSFNQNKKKKKNHQHTHTQFLLIGQVQI